MTGSPELAITGVTGFLGGHAARSLAGAGVPLRMLARDPARAPDLPGAVTLLASYGDLDRSREALRGARVLFMVSAAEAADRLSQHLTFVEAAAAAGVEHVVYTSFVGAAPGATFTLARDHWATEEAIRASGMGFTFLRDNLYLDFLPHLAGEDGVIRGPAGNGRVASVTRADVVRSAVAVLTDPDAHRDITYDLTGPAAHTLAEVAAIVGEETGRAIRFHDETVAEAYESRKQWPAPAWQYDAWVSTYTAIAAGEMDGVSGDVERLTGRPPTGLREFLAQGD